jgi:integrase
MILTAARPSEALHAPWGEIDWAKRLWIVPPPRMKGAREHRVPLSPAALWLLERQVLVRTGDLIFPFRGGSPISYDAFASKPAHLGIDAASPHGWRSTFKDYCGDIAENVPRNLAEAALAHSLGGVEGAYRKLTAVEKRRAVMESYAAWLMSDDRKVVAISDHRASRMGGKAKGSVHGRPT